MVSKILLLAFFVGTASASIGIAELAPKPAHLAHKEGCYIWQVDDVIPFGTTVTPIGYCVRMHCGTKWVEYASCGILTTTNPKCHITDIDLTKPYPSCCPNIKCDRSNKLL